MLGHSARPLVCLLTALLFALSMMAQGLLTTAAYAKMMAPASAMADAPMDCPEQDEASRGACVAACAGVIGILAEIPALSFFFIPSGAAERLIEPLSDRSISPNPHPPRPSALS